MPVITSAQRLVEEIPSSAGRPPNQEQWISEPGGLSQFGALVQVLQPGTQSSIKHWHSSEDELVYVLEGEVTVVEGQHQAVMYPGDAATFKSGVAVGHTLLNQGAVPATYLVIGTRAAVDQITYPDHDRICLRDRAAPDDVWTDLAGTPAASPYA